MCYPGLLLYSSKHFSQAVRTSFSDLSQHPQRPAPGDCLHVTQQPGGQVPKPVWQPNADITPLGETSMDWYQVRSPPGQTLQCSWRPDQSITWLLACQGGVTRYLSSVETHLSPDSHQQPQHKYTSSHPMANKLYKLHMDPAVQIQGTSHPGYGHTEYHTVPSATQSTQAAYSAGTSALPCLRYPPALLLSTAGYVQKVENHVLCVHPLFPSAWYTHGWPTGRFFSQVLGHSGGGTRPEYQVATGLSGRRDQVPVLRWNTSFTRQPPVSPQQPQHKYTSIHPMAIKLHSKYGSCCTDTGDFPPRVPWVLSHWTSHCTFHHSVSDCM